MRIRFRLKLKRDKDGILVSGLEIQTKTRSVKILPWPGFRIVRTSRKLGLGFSLSLHMTILEPGTDCPNLCSCSRSFMFITGIHFRGWTAKTFLVFPDNSNTILFKGKYLMGLAGLWTGFQVLSTRPR